MENSPLKILAIDDNEDNLTSVKALIREAFPQALVLTATEAGKGIGLAQAEAPDVILLDVVMPGMDGFEACQKLKANPLTRFIPVVFLTAIKGDKEARIRALEVGAEAFLSKPIDEVELTAQIRAMQKIKAAGERERAEKEDLSELVSTRTLELEVAYTAALNLLDDLRKENTARRESERRLQKIFDILPVGLWFADKTGKLLRGNTAGVKIWGAEPRVDPSQYGVFKARRLPSGEEIAPADWSLAHTIREGTTTLDELLEIDAFDGQKKIILNFTAPVLDDDGAVLGAVIVNQDITARKRAEAAHAKLQEQFTQAQKMEAVGRLAGGVAHDFNNLLMGIMGYTQLCRDKIAPDHPIREWLDEITSESKRSAEITRQLLAFARKQTIAPRVLDINDAVAGMLKLLRRLIGEDIKLNWRPGLALRPVKLDPSQVDQILANLCVNARDAIAGVGEIAIETGSIVIDAAYRAAHPEVIPGAYVFLAVSDNGCGMDKETLAQVFEPFFTTKELGKGTGLGLATVYGIVKQNNGFIYADSEPGRGTTFKIYLPEISVETMAVTVTSKTEAPRGRGETILLVEDEKSLRVTCGAFLDALGYKVLVAETPGEALKMVAGHPGAIHVLLTDVVMPGMDGRQMAQRISAVKPGVQVLFMSGYTADVIAHRGVLDEGVQFLAKPFTRDDLARKVREVLTP